MRAGGYRTALRSAVSSEAKAYGFTLVIWGTGALLVYEQGTPRPYEVLLFAAGALAAMTIAVLAAFGGPRATWTEEEPLRYAFGALRVVSVIAALLVGWLVAAVLGETAAYLLAPFASVSLFQLLLGVEIAASIAE